MCECEETMIFFILIVLFITFVDVSGFALSKRLTLLLYSANSEVNNDDVNLKKESFPEDLAKNASDYIFGGETFEDTEK